MSKARRTVLLVIPVFLVATLVGCASDAGTDDPHFSYSGAEGPDHWGELSAEWETCKTGTEQSPIALTNVPTEGDQDLAVHYPGEVSFDAEDNGHTVQVAPAGDAFITSGGTRFDLVQVHFHAPSEHEIDGEKAAAEFHFVHASADDDLLVVGVLAREGRRSSAWEPFLAAAARATAEHGDEIDADEHEPDGHGFEHAHGNADDGHEADNPDDERLDLAALLPTSLDHFSYEGSLTTPPCTEGVEWRVLQTPVELNADQITRLRAAHDHNARPLQPLDDRSIRQVG